MDHLWIPFLDKTQSDIIVSAIIKFHIYKILVTNWKHGTGANDIIPFNGYLEILLTSILEQVNIDESSNEGVILFFITNK